MNHLEKLESESIHIFREVVSETKNPVMLYSIGKDSAVMLHIAIKAFFPAPLPFKLLHVDTGWKFQEMYKFRDYIKKKHTLELIVHQNENGLKENINPFDHGSSNYTHIMKTEALIQAINKYKYEVAFAGARRDEEKSRSKERIFSFRSANHQWDPKNQRAELWNIYNTKLNYNETFRVFPLSNWTELDIWQYIYQENIEIVPLYFSKPRMCVERKGSIFMVDDDRMKLHENETVKLMKIRFRTLGCYPLTSAIISSANNVEEIISELLITQFSERQGRIIDHENSSMEEKKINGYF